MIQRRSAALDWSNIMARNPDWFLFNKILESYDKLKFPKEPCDRLVVHAGIREGERVLDVAYGTVWVAQRKE
jgi:hypothetical protein